MPNPYVNKVELSDGTTLIDLTADTVDTDSLLAGYTAHDASGAPISGTATAGTAGVVYIKDSVDTHGGTIRSIETEDGVITDTTDPNGGTVRSIVGAEVYLQEKVATPTETAQNIEPDQGYDALTNVRVGAISSTYIGSGVTQRSTSDLTASGATVTAPAGYYENGASKTIPDVTYLQNNQIGSSQWFSFSQEGRNVNVGFAGGNNLSPIYQAGYAKTTDEIPVTVYASSVYQIPSGTEGTPTATKGTVSNHSVTVTPSVTNSAGYISGGTKTGTGVSVSASELVSGTYSVTSSGTKDVTNYASASVPSGTEGTPTATKGTVSNHSVSVTPSVTNTSGFITGGTKTGTAVSVSASELVSGNLAITENGTGIDVVGYSTVSVTVPSGGNTCTISGTGNSASLYVQYNNIIYYSNNDTFTFTPGGSLYCYCSYGDSNAISINGVNVASGSGIKSYTYTLPSCDISISLTRSPGTSGIDIIIPTLNITSSGLYDVTSYGFANVSVSSGLVYETGTWEPQADIDRGEILFNNAHTIPPIYVCLTDATNTFSDATYSNYGFYWIDWWRITGVGMYASSGTQYYCEVIFDYKGSSGTSMSNSYKKLSQNSDYQYTTVSNYPRYWVTPTGFNPYTDSADRYWRAGRTYKWIAVWAPTT